MKREVKGLNNESVDDAVMFVEEDLEVPDLSGEHLAEVRSLEKRTSRKGNTYYTVRVRICSGAAEGESVFGTVFPGRPLRTFLQAVGIDPSRKRELRRDEVIGKKVTILVGTQEVEGVGGSVETEYVISRFLRQPTSDEPAKEIL